MPWIHWHVSSYGKVNACCVAPITYGDINKDSFDDIWHGNKIESLRKAFANGESDKRCAVCLNTEASGGKSIRQETHDNYHYISTARVSNPIYLDIRFSNLCNLRCITCWHGASSSWFKDSKVLGTNLGDKPVIKNINNLSEFMEKMDGVLLGIKELYFAGGEPLVTEEHYLLLEWLITQNKTNCLLRYNTNLTRLNFKNYNLLSLWEKFEKVEVMVSIDAPGEIGEYIRKDSVWNNIASNLKKIQQINGIKVIVSPTISVLNVFSLPSLIREMHKVFDRSDYLYLNYLDRPIHYNIQILPAYLKKAFAEKVSEFLLLDEFTEDYKVQLMEVIRYMNASNKEKLWPRFLQEKQKLEEIRGNYIPLETLFS